MTTLFSRLYLRNRSTSDIGVYDYISLFELKEHSPEVWHIPPRTPCIYIYIYIYSTNIPPIMIINRIYESQNL